MPFWTRRIFIQDFIGLSNRLEALVLAFALQRAHGHEVWLDWPELDALRVAGTLRGGPGLACRVGAARVRECNSAQFAQLGQRRHIILRTFYGPGERLEPIYAETAARVTLRSDLADHIRQTLRKLGARPVVGLHLRRGDFVAPDGPEFDAGKVRYPAVPLWWYEFVMGKIVQRAPETAFLACCTGDPEQFAPLRKNFDLFEIETLSPYQKGLGHKSLRHPAADLFALACCPVILATPVSSFSHYAAHALGSESICLFPPPLTRRDAPGIARVHLYGRPLRYWLGASRRGEGLEPVSPDLSGIALDMPANCDWIKAHF